MRKRKGQHQPISRQSDDEEQNPLTSKNNNERVWKKPMPVNKQLIIESVVAGIILIFLLLVRVYIRSVLYPEAVRISQNKYQQYVQEQKLLAQILNQELPQFYAYESKQHPSINDDLIQLIHILSNPREKKQQKSIEQKDEKQVGHTSVRDQAIKKGMEEIEEFQKNLDQKMLEKYGEKVTTKDGDTETIIGFKPIAGITEQKVVMAKKLRKITGGPIDSMSQQAIKQLQYYEEHYSISKYEEQPFCIVVPTFNNEPKERYQKNIDSIIQQNYSNYHVVIIQDASTDNTGRLIDQYVEKVIQQYPEHNFKDKFKIIHNQEQRRALPNLRRAALQFCEPKEIFMIVDGDDQLVGRQVLKFFNSQFQEKDLWFMYTNSMTHLGSIGFSRFIRKEVKENNSYRKTAFSVSHLRAYYTQLFRLIKQEDLKDDKGEYFRAANDVAICLPVMEMAHERVGYIPQVTYLYNSNTGNNNHYIRLDEQTKNNRYIRTLKPYEPLEELFPQT